jgi:hypothetical protein
MSRRPSRPPSPRQASDAEPTPIVPLGGRRWTQLTLRPGLFLMLEDGASDDVRMLALEICARHGAG